MDITNLASISGKIYASPLTVHGQDSLISLDVSCAETLPDEYPSKLFYRVYLLVDTSGSMDGSIQHLKYAILTLCDEIEICAKKGINIQLTLIEFNNSAEIIHEGPVTDELKNRIGELYARGQTNLGQALELAVLRMNVHGFESSVINQLIILTDGQANMGHCSLEALDSILQKRPYNTIVEILGYTDEPCSRILENLGHYTMVDSLEMASGVIGAIMANCINTIGFNAEIMTSDHFKVNAFIKTRSGSFEKPPSPTSSGSSESSPPNITRRDSQAQEITRFNSDIRDVIGSAHIHHLYAGKQFTYGLAYRIASREALKRGTFWLRYTDVRGEPQEICLSFDYGLPQGFSLIPDEEIPEELLKKYYVHSSTRLFDSIKCGNVQFVKTRVGTWHPCGGEIASKLVKYANEPCHSKHEEQMISTMKSNTRYQITHLPSCTVKSFACFMVTSLTSSQRDYSIGYTSRFQDYALPKGEMGFPF